MTNDVIHDLERTGRTLLKFCVDKIRNRSTRCMHEYMDHNTQW